MRRLNYLYVLVVLSANVYGADSTSVVAPPALIKLPYNHAYRLVVDLQVGLWAQPLPMDWDGDGDLDMVAATSGMPSNGVWFFENVSGPAGGEGVGSGGTRLLRRDGAAPRNDRGRDGAAPRNDNGGPTDRAASGGGDELRIGQTNVNLRGVSSAPESVVTGDTRLPRRDGAAPRNDDHVTIGASAPRDVVFKAGVWVARGLEDMTVSYVNGEPMVCVPGEAKVRAAGSATPFGGALSGAIATNAAGANSAASTSESASSVGAPAGAGPGIPPQKECTGVVYPDFRKTGLEKGQTIPVVSLRSYNRTRADQWKFVDYDGDGAVDVVLGLGVWDDYGWDDAYNAQGVWTNGPLHGYVMVARNEGTTASPKYGAWEEVSTWVENHGDPRDGKWTDPKSVDVYGAPSPNFADFDGDGDLDLVCGEFLDSLTYFENVGTRTESVYARGRLLARDGAAIRMDLQMLQVIALDWDADGDTDLIVGQEDGRIALMEHTGAVKDGMPVFELPRFFQQEADYLRVGVLPAPAGVDWDGDGDEDLICGDTAGYLNFVENTGMREGLPIWAPPVYLDAGGARVRIQAGTNGGIQGPCEAKWGYTVPAVGDWDGDGDSDIVMNSIWGEILWYENVGTKAAAKLAAARPVEIEWTGATPKPQWTWWDPKGKQLVTQWRTSPYLGDMNGDGLVDLAMLDREGYLALFARARRDGKLVTLSPTRVFLGEDGKPLQLNAGRAGKSGRRKFTFCDWDGDGKMDLMLDSTNVDFWRNVSEEKGEWKFKNLGPIAEQNLLGHTTDPTVVDWNKDGVPDVLIGAEDGCLYYCENPRTKVK